MPVSSTPIQFGSTINQSLTLGQRLNYSFEVLLAQELRIFLDGQGLADAYLRVYDANNNLVAQDDDSGGNSDSLIRRTFEPGQYRIEVAGYRDRFSGSFALSLSGTATATNTLSTTLGTDEGLTPTISSGGSTRDTSVALTGTVAPNTTIEIYDGDQRLDSSSQSGSLIQIQGSSWRYVATGLLSGDHTLKAKFLSGGGPAAEQSVLVKVDSQVNGTLSSTMVTDTRLRQSTSP